MSEYINKTKKHFKVVNRQAKNHCKKILHNKSIIVRLLHWIITLEHYTEKEAPTIEMVAIVK